MGGLEVDDDFAARWVVLPHVGRVAPAEREGFAVRWSEGVVEGGQERHFPGGDADHVPEFAVLFEFGVAEGGDVVFFVYMIAGGILGGVGEGGEELGFFACVGGIGGLGWGVGE